MQVSGQFFLFGLILPCLIIIIIIIITTTTTTTTLVSFSSVVCHQNHYHHYFLYLSTFISSADRLSGVSGVIGGTRGNSEAEEGPVVVVGPEHGEVFPAVPPAGHAQRPLVHRDVRSFR